RDLTPEDDVATALWEKRLVHLKYEFINVFAEGDAADREHFYDEADRVEHLARRAAEERSNRAEAAAMAVTTDEGALVAARKAASVLALDPVAKKALGAQLIFGPDRLSERFGEVGALAFLEPGRRGDVLLVTDRLHASMRDLAIARRFDLIFTMHDALRRALDALTPDDARPMLATLKAELTRGMFAEETLALML